MRRPGGSNARIDHWAIMELTTPGEPAYRHIVGYVVTHDRLSADDENKGEPYIGSPVASFDVSGPGPVAINHSGRRIELLTPLRDGPMPPDLVRQMQHALQAWGLPEGSKWERLSLEEAQARAEADKNAAAETP